MLKKGILGAGLLAILALFLWFSTGKPETANTEPLQSQNQITNSQSSEPNPPESSEPQRSESQQDSVENDDAESEILACLPELFEDAEDRKEKLQQYFEDYDARRADATKRHLSNADAFNYSLFATPPEGKTRLDLLMEYHQQFPGNPLISTDIINACIHSEDERCNDSLIEELLLVDSNNGATYFAASKFYAVKENNEKVIAHIKNIEKASTFNERYGERVLTYAQALEGAEVEEFILSATEGVGVAAGNFSPSKQIFDWCQKGQLDVVISDACISLGSELAERGKTLLTRSIGIGIQLVIYEEREDNEIVRALETKRQSWFQRSDTEADRAASFMMMLDERLLRRWLENIDTHGEVESHAMIQEEATYLYETQGENALCNLIYDVMGGHS